jgi:hypothetical protein
MPVTPCKLLVSLMLACHAQQEGNSRPCRAMPGFHLLLSDAASHNTWLDWPSCATVSQFSDDLIPRYTDFGLV